MTSSLPCVSGKQVVTALGRAGYLPVRCSGSHQILKHSGPLSRPQAYRTVAVPLRREIPVGTLAGILRRVALTAEEFDELLRH